ncbi:flagellar hook 2 domain-containing protein [Duganella sp. BJB488]|uniref:flagellar filament capping protein FliD n=1 Tax=unclassified Duganella TaxID=2636909 RepID=UPI000E350708|nr:MULTISPECIES: flagellar filament capping protein FliD [unclassified Duganella]RFP15321.1 flagellar hook 2 domain-containing protein [Duganella sp. BJB489]RFP19877.1 flagellar hook 2 domain-containing protein [Duganella sp. BJB488]RFP38265.1 flagellar hook 2 domain-containing protein [Duganella sp. BJB480]
MATSSINSSTNTGSSTVSNDIYNRVQQTMASQNKAATKLNTTLKNDQTKLSALGQLQSALANFQSIAAGLTGSGLSTSAATSVKNVLTAASTGAAKAGTYAINVKQLAQGQFLTSDAFAAADAKIGSGAVTTVKIDFGTAGGDKGYTLNSAAAGKSITIDASNNTLDGIAAAFKAAGVDVKVVKGDDGKFSLAIAGQSGAANTMRISVSGDAALKNLLAFDPDGAQKLKQTSAGMDAIVNVDGKDVTSATNTLDKAIPGATLTLTGAGKTDVTITQDASQIGANLKSFVSAYNDLNKKLQALQKGDLKSDTALGQVTGQLGMLLKTGGGSVSLAALNAAGVSQDSSGQLVVDDKKLTAALATDSAGVGKLFTNGGKGIADLLSSKAAAFTSDSSVISKEAGLLGREITNINGRRTVLTKALTAQATALAALYTAQAQTGAGSALNGAAGSSGSLFDILG